MSKPIGFFCSGAMPGDTGLIADMQESWGSCFELLNNAQRLWILQMAGQTLFQSDPNSVLDSAHDQEIEAATERLEELSKYELLSLLEALISQIKSSRE